MSGQFFWFATRGAGILCWFAATLSLLVGLMMSSRALGRRPTVPWLLDVHRYFGAMSMVFLAAHLFSLWADSFVDFGWSELFVPGVAAVPGLAGWSLVLGVFAGWHLALIELSSLVKKHLPNRFWHTLHLTSFGVVVSGAVHGLEAGSDSDNTYLVAAVTSVVAAVVLLTIVRFFSSLLDRKYRYEVMLSDELGDEQWDGVSSEAYFVESGSGYEPGNEPSEGDYDGDSYYEPSEGDYDGDSYYEPSEGDYDGDNYYEPSEGDYEDRHDSLRPPTTPSHVLRGWLDVDEER